MGNKQEELEVCIHLKGYNLTGIMEMGVLEWKDTGPSGKADWGDEEGESHQ